MPDMLVKLYALPEAAPHLADLKTAGIFVRRAHAWEKPVIGAWAREQFSRSWGIACEVACEQRPVTVFIAVEQDCQHQPDANPYHLPAETLVGFACYDVASRGMFGPTGVRQDYRRRGIGTARLLASLNGMAEEGYAYAIIGQVGPVEFYARTVGATVIEGSEPGIARRELRG